MSRKSNSDPISLFAFQDIITAVTGVLLLIVLLLSLNLVQLPEEQGEPKQVSESDQQRRSEITSQIAALKSMSVTAEESMAAMPASEIRRRIANATQELNQLQTTAERLKQLEGELKESKSKLDSRREAIAPKLKQIESMKSNLKKTVADAERLNSSNRRLYNFRKASTLPWVLDLTEKRTCIAKAKSDLPPVTFDQTFTGARTSATLDWIRRRPPSDRYFVLVVREKTVDTYRQIRTGLEQIGADIGVDLVGPTVTVVDPVEGLKE